MTAYRRRWRAAVLVLVLENRAGSWGGFDFADRCSNRFLYREDGFWSRRDYRTQPGVLTPGRDKKGARPEGGGREAFSALDAERDPQSISAAPSGRGPIVNVSWG